jgi:putative membrane protein
MTVATDFWKWHPHPEVWVLIASLTGLGFYISRVIGPKVVAPGEVAVTLRQKRFFATGVSLLWLASDWPIHDIGEKYLYSVHMVQHLLITIVVAPLFLLATPTWLARLIIGDGWFAGGIIRRLCHPVAAGVIYNAVFVFTHWPAVVDNSVKSAPEHFTLHCVLMAAALLMWMPVCGPLPERRMSSPGQMFYLFCQSIIPTIPAAWLILAEKPVYKVYDIPQRMFGLSTVTDQQIAGLLMKLGAGTYLWVLIVVLFFRWANDEKAWGRHPTIVRSPVAPPGPEPEPVVEDVVLTWEQVEAELARLPAPHPPTGHAD